MFSILKQLGVNFKSEKVFEWARDKRYDFYLQDYNVIIEMMGEQHYSHDIYYTKCSKIIENDNIKRQLAISNGINIDNYICIDSKVSDVNYIFSKVCESNLSSILALEKVDIDKIQSDIQSKPIKEVARLWDGGTHDLNEIAKIVGLHPSTTSRLIRKGADIGINSYTKEDSIKMGVIKTKQSRYQNGSIPCMCIEDGTCFGNFSLAEKYSESIYGVKLDRHCVRGNCYENINM